MLLLDEDKLERRTLARNELLFRQGDKVQAIYFIEEGRLRLDRRTFDGRSLVFGTNSTGEFFVEAALFAEIFHCDAVATEPSRVRVYPKTLMDHLSERAATARGKETATTPARRRNPSQGTSG